MKKLTCIAIDDEPIALLIISQFCERKGGLELTTFSEPLTGLKEIARCKPDLVFLDIEMNSISGLDIAHALPPESCLIFTNSPGTVCTGTASTSMPWIFCTSPSLMNDLKKQWRKRFVFMKHARTNYRKTS